MMFRLLLVVVMLVVGPLAQAVECVMAVPAAQGVHHCEMMGQPASPSHPSMTVAECLEVEAVASAVDAPVFAVMALPLPPETVSRVVLGRAFKVDSSPVRPPPWRSGREVLLLSSRLLT